MPRGKTPSSTPSRQTTRCGTERIGTIVHMVSSPVRKFARVGRPRSRPPSSERTSLSPSGTVPARSPAEVSTSVSSRRVSVVCQASAGAAQVRSSTPLASASTQAESGCGPCSASTTAFQDAGSSLTPWMSVGETLGERLRPLKLSRAEVRQRVIAALAAVDLPPEVAKARPGELSGGQRQRVVLARATMIPPAVLLCDEPTSALDASLAKSVLALIRDLRARIGMTVLFVTHDLAVARLMGDRIAVMQAGRVVELGPAEQVIAEPREPYTRTLLAAVPEIVEGAVS